MIYLTEDDIEVIIIDYTLLDILELDNLDSGSTILNNAERTAVDIAFSYLTNIYDKDIEVAKTGDTRDYMVVNAVATITRYLLYQRQSANIVPEHVLEAYNLTIERLRDIQNRKILPKISKKESTDETYVPRVVSDSNTPRTSFDY